MILLSHELNSQTPAYANGPSLEVVPEKRICAGDSCNSQKVSFSNHLGTHVDCPLHFDSEGKSLTDYEPDFWMPSPVGIVGYEADPGEIIHADALMSRPGFSSLPANLEALIIKTGFGELRDREDFWKRPPAYAPELADWLRNRFSQIRFFGFDSISLSSLVHRDMGREAHRAFLKNKHPILILEDMDLTRIKPPVISDQILISPLFLSGADGAPCTIWMPES